MAEINDLDVTDSSNTGRFPENQTASSVNDGARALEGMLARAFRDVIDGAGTTAGTLTAYTLSPNRTITAYYDGLMFAVKWHLACGATPTINVSSLGAKTVKWSDGTAIAAGDIPINARTFIQYDGTDFLLLGTPKKPLFELADDSVPPAKLTDGAKPYDVAFVAGYEADFTTADLAVQTYAKLVIPRDVTFDSVTAILETTADSTITIQMYKGGGSIFTTTPKISSGNTSITTAAVFHGSNATFAAGDVLRFAITATGTTDKGKGLMVTLGGKLA